MSESERSSTAFRLRPRWPHRSRDRNSPSSRLIPLGTPRATLESNLQPLQSSQPMQSSPSSIDPAPGLEEPDIKTLQTRSAEPLPSMPVADNLFPVRDHGESSDPNQMRRKRREEVADRKRLTPPDYGRTPSAPQVSPDSERENHSWTETMNSSPFRELWDEAFRKLRSENQELVDVYENVLKKGSEVPASATHNKQMQDIVNSRLREIESKQWRIRMGKMDVSIRDQADRVVGLVLAIRDVGNAVAALNPVHAGIPWAGICALLSVVVNDSVAQAAVLAGLEKIAVIVPRYKQVENLYLSRAKGGAVLDQLRDALVGLYANILAYQIEVARHLMHRAFVRFAKSTLQLDDWNAKLQKVKDSDEHCKNIMILCDAQMAADTSTAVHNRLSQLDDRINQRITDIMTSKSQKTVVWSPGPNTDPGYVAVLYGGFQAKAGLYRISLADVDNDATLFTRLRLKYAERQHPVRVALSWLIWFSVKRLEFVKYKTKFASKASYAHTGEAPLSQLLPMERRMHAWHYPSELDFEERECLAELRAVLAAPEQWGVLIVEEFDVVRFFINISITVGLSLVIQMVTEDFGRTAMESLRASFIGMFASVIVFGVFAHSALIDIIHEVCNRRRLLVFSSFLLAGALMDALESRVNELLRHTVNIFLIVGVLAGLLYEP